MTIQEKMREQQLESAECRIRLHSTLTSHIGRANAVGMAELYEAVYDRHWENRINDTRKLRTLVTEMRREGVAICSTAFSVGGGYYLAAGGSELKDYLRRTKVQALKKLARVAKIQRISLPELLGQLRLEMEAGDGEAA